MLVFIRNRMVRHHMVLIQPHICTRGVAAQKAIQAIVLLLTFLLMSYRRQYIHPIGGLRYLQFVLLCMTY